MSDEAIRGSLYDNFQTSAWIGLVEFLRAFLPWVTKEHWGEEDVTPGISDILERIAPHPHEDRASPVLGSDGG